MHPQPLFCLWEVLFYVYFSLPRLSHTCIDIVMPPSALLHTGQLSSFCPFPSTDPFAELCFNHLSAFFPALYTDTYYEGMF